EDVVAAAGAGAHDHPHGLAGVEGLFGILRLPRRHRCRPAEHERQQDNPTRRDHGLHRPTLYIPYHSYGPIGMSRARVASSAPCPIALLAGSACAARNSARTALLSRALTSYNTSSARSDARLGDFTSSSRQRSCSTCSKLPRSLVASTRSTSLL